MHYINIWFDFISKSFKSILNNKLFTKIHFIKSLNLKTFGV